MRYFPRTTILLFFLLSTAPLSFSQEILEIKTEVNTNMNLLPENTIPAISVQFVGTKNLQIKATPQFQSKTPYYGKIDLGNSGQNNEIIIVLDEKKQAEPRVYVDTNKNGDLTDDNDPFWTDNIQGVLSKRISISVVLNEDGNEKNHHLPYKLLRFENPLTKQIRVVLQPAFLREGRLKLGNLTYKVLAQTYNRRSLFSNTKDITIAIDRDLNGAIDDSLLSAEIFWGGANGGKPFNIGGESYYVRSSSASGDRISLAVSKKKVPPKNYISVSKKAPKFSFKDLNGTVVNFKSLENRVIMLDFWATWCRPCVKNLPKLKQLNDKFSSEDFAIVGISLDGGAISKTRIQEMKDFVAKRDLIWPTSFENLGMDSSIGKSYNIVDIPFYIIVDKQGVIRLVERGSNEVILKRIQDTIENLIVK